MRVRDLRDSLRCSRCGEHKQVDEFAWRRKAINQRDTYCRPCRSAYGKEHYHANRERYLEQADALKRQLVRARTELILEYFAAHPCVDCGNSDPVVLEFDHLRDQSFNVSTGLACKSWAKVIREIEKCEVVCCNCHRRRTAIRRGSWRAILTAEDSEPPEEI